jgi:hypothetical protein
MLLAIVLLFLLVEIPPGVAYMLFLPTVFTELGVSVFTVIISQNDYIFIALVLNICVLVSYPVNFIIYCAMSRQFRETFVSLFGAACGYARNHRTSTVKARSRTESQVPACPRANGNIQADTEYLSIMPTGFTVTSTYC